MLEHELLLRLSIFLTVLVFVAVWEFFAPRRKLSYKRLLRWPANFSLSALNALLLRMLIPAGAIGAATWSQSTQIGLFYQLSLNNIFVFIGSLLLLDLAIYCQHVVFHKVPILWRIHRMHHADLDLDVTSGSRFHPIEIFLSMGFKILLVTLLGISPLAVLTFEIILNATAMFNHGNIFLSNRIDSKLRLFLVTPDMHRVHHSKIPEETNSNFGFNIPWWDRLFSTYTEQPSLGHNDMEIGLKVFEDKKFLSLKWLLALPFVKKN